MTDGRRQKRPLNLVCRLSSVFCHLEVGFPIRKFSDQSLFAAPRDLSQRTTSFIASQRQGIHRIPFRHLIVLIIEKPDSTPAVRISKRPFCFKHTRDPMRSSRERWQALINQGSNRAHRPCGLRMQSTPAFRPDVLPLHDVRDGRRRTDDGERMFPKVRLSPSNQTTEDGRQRTDVLKRPALAVQMKPGDQRQRSALPVGLSASN